MGNRVILQLREAVVPMVGTFGCALTGSSTLSAFHTMAHHVSRPSCHGTYGDPHPTLSQDDVAYKARLSSQFSTPFPRAHVNPQCLPAAEVKQKRNVLARYHRRLAKKPSLKGICIYIKRTVDCFTDDDGAVGKQSVCMLAMVSEAVDHQEEAAPARTDSEVESRSDIHESDRIPSSSRINHATELDSYSSCSDRESQNGSSIWDGEYGECFSADDESGYMTPEQTVSRSLRESGGSVYLSALRLELGGIDTWKPSPGHGHERN